MNRFMDSFDHYVNPEYKYDSFSNVTIDNTSGRYGTAGANLNVDGVSYLQLDLDNQNGWSVGCAYNRNSTPDGGDLFGLYTDSSGSTRQAGLAVLPTGALSVTSSGSTVVTTLKTIAAGTWYYVEWDIELGSPGTTAVYVNGNQWATASGTLLSSGSTASTLLVSGVGHPFLDDLYVNDSSGSVNNSVWGDTRIESVYPSSDGSYQQWDKSTGSSGWSIVGNNPPYLGEFISSGSLNSRSTFPVTSVSAGTGNIKSVQQLRLANKNDITFRENRNIVRLSSGSVYVGDTDQMTNSPLYYRTNWQTSPDGSDWDETSLASSEFGVEAVS